MLTIETANVHLDEDYVRGHLESRSGPHVMLAVSDTGCGIEEEMLPHIFEPFFTTKELGKGTGLGLSTVYGIVKQSGGSIWVYSELDQGTSVKMYLPRVDKAVDGSPHRDQRAGGDAPRGSETVFVVEDEPSVRALAVRVLSSYGYTVLSAESPQEAFELERDYAGSIHLVLTDVVLPGMNGREMVDALVQRRPQPFKVLFMSGYTRNAMIHDGHLDPDIAFLEKPFTPEALACRVRESLDDLQAEQPTILP
ncbi:MAG: ATP-binding protein, partial [Actinobacteria bacterium]|nr:ATP-binding protein [Actinomycetota bacterium]